MFAGTIKPLSKKSNNPDSIKEFFEKHYCRDGQEEMLVFGTYEVDKSGVLHYHFLLACESQIRNIKNVRYWHQYLEKVRGFGSYISYITKNARNQDEQDQILLNHYAANNNMFMDL